MIITLKTSKFFYNRERFLQLKTAKQAAIFLFKYKHRQSQVKLSQAEMVCSCYWKYRQKKWKGRGIFGFQPKSSMHTTKTSSALQPKMQHSVPLLFLNKSHMKIGWRNPRKIYFCVNWMIIPGEVFHWKSNVQK